MLHSFILKLIIYIFFPRVFPVSVNSEEMSVFYQLNIVWKFSSILLRPSLVQYYTVHTWAVCAEPSAIQHMPVLKEHPSATEPPAPQPNTLSLALITGLLVCVHTCDSWKLRSFVLPLIHCEQSICCLSLLSVFPTLFFSLFFCPLVTCTVECFTLLSTLKMLAYLLKWKAFSVPRLSHCGPFTKYFWYCFTPPTLTTREAPPKCKNPRL